MSISLKVFSFFLLIYVLLYVVILIVGSQEFSSEGVGVPTQMFSGEDGTVVVYEQDIRTVHFLTSNGFLYRSTVLDTPVTVQETRYFEEHIHSSGDTVEVSTELVDDRLYWGAVIRSQDHHSVSYLGLRTLFGTEVVRLCDHCSWSPLAGGGYVVRGVVPRVGVREWSLVYDITFRALME